MNLQKLIIFTFLFYLLILKSVVACRFNVRETGFVDLGDEQYYLAGYINDRTPPGIIETFLQVTKKRLSEANIEFQMINVSTEKNHPALIYLHDLTPENFPSAMLISPDGHSFNLSLHKAEQMFGNSLESALDVILSSPTRNKLQRQLIDKYAVILIIEGREKEANIRAQKSAQEAVVKITKKMDLMPKTIKEPPVSMVIKYEKVAEDPFLMWVLGLEVGRMDKPHAAIFYGRARWLGPLFRDEEITRDNLSEILFVVGADCECGLDKNWLRGTVLPMCWDKKTQIDIAENLGFDPDNPLTKIEVNRIMRSGHYAPADGIPSPAIYTRADTTDSPRQGIRYDEDSNGKDTLTVADSATSLEGSMLSRSVIISIGILVLLLLGGIVFVLYRQKRS